MSEFTSEVNQAAEKAKRAAEKESGGDPGTMVSASVDGRTGFVNQFKQEGEKQGNKWVIGDVSLDEDYGLHLSVLSGTDIQLHSKKIAAYRAFEKEMEKQGWNCGLEISSYSY